MHRQLHPPWFYHCKNMCWGLRITICNYAVYRTCRSLVHVNTKFKISLHATLYWYGRIWYRASIRNSSGKLSLQNVAVCDVDVRKGENAVRELQTEYGADRVIFIKTDVTNVAELEGNVETFWMLENFLTWDCQRFEQKGLWYSIS